MFLMSRHYTLLAVMLVMTVTHPIVRHPTDVGVRQLLVKARSWVIHPLVLQSVEPHTGTQWPVCNESPESVKPVGSALWNNPAVIPNRVGFVKLSQIGVFVDSINKPQGVMEIWFQLL